MQKKITIKEIAKLANVSVGSVSTVFSKRPTTTHLSSETRQRILETARKYNYSPSILARSIQSKKSYLLGFFYRPDNHYLFHGLLKGIRKVCSLHDYDIIVYPANNLEEETANLQSSHVKELDGIITIPLLDNGRNNGRLYQSLALSGIPLIQIFYQCWKEYPALMRDYQKIGQEAVQTLYDHGHRHIGILIFSNYTDPVDGINNWNLMQGVQSKIDQLGLSLEVFPIDDGMLFQLRENYIKNAFSIADIITRKKNMPTALIAASSNLAYGIYAGLLQHQICIPKDISLLACGDDTEPFWQIVPSLTHFPIPFECIGEKSAEYCLSSPEARKEWPLKTTFFSPLNQGMTI